MGRFWSLLFLIVSTLGTLCYLAGMFAGSGPLAVYRFEHANSLNAVGARLQALTLTVAAIAFAATGLTISSILWRIFAENVRVPAEADPRNQRLRAAWIVGPVLILSALAMVQLRTWRQNTPGQGAFGGLRYVGADGQPRPESGQPISPRFELTWGLFELRIRYAGADGRLGTADDLVGEAGQLHVPARKPSVGWLRASEVSRSFSIPDLLLGCDIAAGSRRVVWFQAEQEGSYEMVCNELSGLGHYAAQGRLVVDSADAYDAYLMRLKERQFQRDYSFEKESALSLREKTDRRAWTEELLAGNTSAKQSKASDLNQPRTRYGQSIGPGGAPRAGLAEASR